MHKYINEDVSLGSWLIGLDVEHIDDRRLCCGTPPGEFLSLCHQNEFRLTVRFTQGFTLLAQKLQLQLLGKVIISLLMPNLHRELIACYRRLRMESSGREHLRSLVRLEVQWYLQPRAEHLGCS